MKKLLIVLLIMILMLVGCGTVYDASTLYEKAQKDHGKCTLVSSENYEDGGSKVVLHDTLQDFDYTITSRMYDINIDGTIFGQHASLVDTFNEKLFKKVLPEFESYMEIITLTSDMTYSIDYPNLTLNIHWDNEVDGRDFSIQLAQLINEQNKYNRLDGFKINAFKKDSYTPYVSIVLPYYE